MEIKEIIRPADSEGEEVEEFKEIALEYVAYDSKSLSPEEFRALQRVARKVYKELVPLGARELELLCRPYWTGWICNIPLQLYRSWERECYERGGRNRTPRLLESLRAKAWRLVREETGVDFFGL